MFDHEASAVFRDNDSSRIIFKTAVRLVIY